MRFQDAINPIAVSLSQLDWTTRAIEDHLIARLPRALSHLAPTLAGALTERFPKSAAPDPGVIRDFIATLPAARRILAIVRKTGRVPVFLLDPPRFRPDPGLADAGLPPLATPDDLAEWLALAPEQLVRFADLRALSARAASDFAPHYRHHLIPKRDGKLRLIEEPKPLLKRLQRRVLHGILDRVPPHPASFGFVRGRCCTQAAAGHAGEEVVLGFDLSSFFPGITYARVYGIFRTLGYPAAVARALTGLCTAVTPHATLADARIAAGDRLTARHLPQGAPTSPALANLAALALDRRLAGLARSLDARYTRYADDLAFSGDRRIAAILLRAVPEIVAEEGFHLNHTKTRRLGRSGRQTVTGLVVNDHLNIPRDAYDRLKSTVHRLSDPTDPRRTDPAFLARLSGQIAWVEQVNPARALSLRRAFDALPRQLGAVGADAP